MMCWYAIKMSTLLGVELQNCYLQRLCEISRNLNIQRTQRAHFWIIVVSLFLVLTFNVKFSFSPLVYVYGFSSLAAYSIYHKLEMVNINSRYECSSHCCSWLHWELQPAKCVRMLYVCLRNNNNTRLKSVVVLTRTFSGIIKTKFQWRMLINSLLRCLATFRIFMT